MSFRRLTLVCLPVIITLTCYPALAGGDATRFVQDRIAIGAWVPPPASEANYKEYADANFNLLIGASVGEVTPEKTAEQLRLCEKLGLKVLLINPNRDKGPWPTGPACWGYLLKDEPPTSLFPSLRTLVDIVRKERPGHLAYINLYPNYATTKQLEAPSYDEHVRQFVEVVNPDVLSMDHYPAMRPDADGRRDYCQNLETMRKYALMAGIPFWNYFNTMPFGSHTDPTEAQLRWQIYTSLAYGAKGILYFCYWTPRGAEFPKGGAIITAEGRRTRHYEQSKRINAAIKNLGPTLMQLTSRSVIRITPKDDAAALLKGSPIRTLTPGDYLIGVFKHADRRRAVLLNNYRHDFTEWPTVEFDAASSKVVEVSPKDGTAAPIIDDSPDMPGLQISLDSGEGRLFLLPAE